VITGRDNQNIKNNYYKGYDTSSYLPTLLDPEARRPYEVAGYHDEPGWGGNAPFTYYRERLPRMQEG
jgi:hypothetical protein